MSGKFSNLERSRSLTARYPMKVAVTFSSGMVFDMSPGVISTGTPPRRETYKVTHAHRRI